MGLVKNPFFYHLDSYELTLTVSDENKVHTRSPAVYKKWTRCLPLWALGEEKPSIWVDCSPVQARWKDTSKFLHESVSHDRQHVVCVCESELLQRDDGVSLCVMSHLVWTILALAHWNITSIHRDSTNALFFNHKYCTSVMHINSQLQHIAKQGERLRKQEERDLQQVAPGSSSVMSQIQIFKDFLLIYYF